MAMKARRTRIQAATKRRSFGPGGGAVMPSMKWIPRKMLARRVIMFW